MEHLLHNKRYDDAGKLCIKILGKDSQLWEEQALKFSKIGQFK